MTRLRRGLLLVLLFATPCLIARSAPSDEILHIRNVWLPGGDAGKDVLVTLVVTAIALPVFIVQGQVRWGPAIVLAVGLAAGGWIGARIAVRGGEKFIRGVMILATLILAGRLLGLYG